MRKPPGLPADPLPKKVRDIFKVPREKLVGAPPRIQKVAADLVEHFERRLEALAPKGWLHARLPLE